MLSVAFFISHMESITYFDSVYACFITYSTIGFGDIDIYVSQFFVMVLFALFFKNSQKRPSIFFSDILTHYRCEISTNTVLTKHQQNWPFSRPTQPPSLFADVIWSLTFNRNVYHNLARNCTIRNKDHSNYHASFYFYIPSLTFLRSSFHISIFQRRATVQ